MRAGEMSMATGPTELPAPLLLDRYRLQRRLGSGGFGTVWLARDERLGRDVAVKILARDRVMTGRFEREARAAARLSHPAIVTLYEASADDEGAYLVTELVRGTTLDRALSAGRLSDRSIVEIGLALCDALEHAHGQGVVHRDVKPSNILIPARPGAAGPPAKLTDFGVARVVGGDTLTRTGELVGTAAYMAPEQAVGRDAAEPADLYSLALVLYEALTGVNPVSVTTPAQATRRLSAHLPPLRRQRRELPRELGQAIDLALRPRAAERGTLEHLHAGLDAAYDRLDDVPGVVEPSRLETRRMFASTAAEEPEARPWAPEPPRTGTEAPRPGTKVPRPGTKAPRPGTERRRGATEPPRTGTDSRATRPPTLEKASHARAPFAPRALAAALTAGLIAWMATHLLHPLPLPPATLALAAGIAVLAMPRLGWIAVSLSTVVILAAQSHPGAALAIGVAALLPVFALPRAGTSWPVPLVAPALGAVGLAGAWPALAAGARTPWRRAALGALGWAWLELASALTGHNLYAPRPHAVPAPPLWTPSLYETAHHVIVPLAGSLAAGAVVWALAAAALPYLRRGRSLGRDAAGVAIWTLALGLATTAALSGARTATPTTASLVLGLLVAAVSALAPTAANRLAAHRQWGSAAPGLA